MIQEITVNQLNDVLRQVFKAHYVSIEDVTIGSWNREEETVHIGIGGQLTVRFRTSRKIKGLPVIDEMIV